MKNRAIITGTTGYIGLNLAKMLIFSGWDVALILRPESSLLKIDFILSNVKLFFFNENPDELVNFFDNFKPEIIFHLASCFLADHDISNIKNLINSNILFGTYLLEAMMKTNVKKIVNTGSAGQYFNNEIKNPFNLYAASKNAFYEILNYYYQAHDFQIINLEIYDSYGPDDWRRKIIPLFIDAWREKTSIDLSPGMQKLHLVYIDDIINAYLISANNLLSEKEKIFLEFSLESNKAITLKEVAGIFESVVNCKLSLNWGKRVYRKREIMEPWSKGQKLPSWKPTVSLETGILKVIESIQRKH